MDKEVKEPEGEGLTNVQALILFFNTKYSIRQEDSLKHFRRQGEKATVQAELRLFNGKPQLVVFYGKTRYTFKIWQRIEPQPHKALMRIVGYKGIESVEKPNLNKHFTEGEQKLRAEMLRQKGY
jgi:hypothetical protein